ncbi:hypothetical protein CJ030_MR8G026856 [Morella rubra]|uniref:Uncharacterized protein n=1 Tax=Morella rubra TaxID=262757 RepID=A0A6A1USH2_9ROSI|nr:hypothetical protein CJ030_MR8G026856 [Morella rubra]
MDFPVDVLHVLGLEPAQQQLRSAEGNAQGTDLPIQDPKRLKIPGSLVKNRSISVTPQRDQIPKQKTLFQGTENKRKGTGTGTVHFQPVFKGREKELMHLLGIPTRFKTNLEVQSLMRRLDPRSCMCYYTPHETLCKQNNLGT